MPPFPAPYHHIAGKTLRVARIVDVGRVDLPHSDELGIRNASTGSVPADAPQAIDAGVHGVPLGVEGAVELEHSGCAVEGEACGDYVGLGHVADARLVETGGAVGGWDIEEGVGPGVVAGGQRAGHPLGRVICAWGCRVVSAVNASRAGYSLGDLTEEDIFVGVVHLGRVGDVGKS